jgi:hypothetical protein
VQPLLQSNPVSGHKLSNALFTFAAKATHTASPVTMMTARFYKKQIKLNII